MESLIVERIVQLANVPLTSELEKILIDLVQSAKEGHLCHRIEGPTHVPNGGPLIVDKNRLYLQRNWAIETEILRKISDLWIRKPEDSSERFKEELTKVQGLQKAQYRALLAASEKMFSVFSGGPGTGKTFTAGCFIRTLANARDKPLKVAIAAPTGKAAAHLECLLNTQNPKETQLTYESSTLHRLLRLQPGKQRLQQSQSIDADLVVVDEASMLDALLLLHLLNAIGPKTRLLLLGDSDQLPPVEGGGAICRISGSFQREIRRIDEDEQ